MNFFHSGCLSLSHAIELLSFCLFKIWYQRASEHDWSTWAIKCKASDTEQPYINCWIIPYFLVFTYLDTSPPSVFLLFGLCFINHSSIQQYYTSSKLVLIDLVALSYNLLKFIHVRVNLTWCFLVGVKVSEWHRNTFV